MPVNVKELFPLELDGEVFNDLASAVREKNPAPGGTAYHAVYSRLRSGWPPEFAILLPPRPKENG